MTIVPDDWILESDEYHSRPRVILGSGFSREISDSMPTMKDLGEWVLDALGLPESALVPFGGNLEQWMSFLSVDQPWLTPADNYKNRGQFAEVSEAVFRVIADAEWRARESQPLPTWLLRLAWTWCDQQAQVVSFNYDTLLERAVGELNRGGSLSDVYAAPLAERTAAGGGSYWGADSPRGNLLRMYKLHGSVNWAFGGLDGPPNDRITLVQNWLRWAHAPEPEQPIPPRDLQLYDDLVPLIVPPTLTKGPFFSNLTLRAQWRHAAEQLRDAARLTVIGYSFPPADLVAQQWVGTSFKGDRMDVIDSWEERPRLVRETLVGARGGADLTGATAIQDYVDRECGDHVAWRIWGEGDDVGARLELRVNDVNILHDMDPRQPPWIGNSYEDAQRWVHTLVDAADGGHAIDRAQGSMSGTIEQRHVVLAPGRRFTIS